MKLICDGNSLAYGQTIETAERQNVVTSSIQISKESLPSKLKAFYNYSFFITISLVETVGAYVYLCENFHKGKLVQE